MDSTSAVSLIDVLRELAMQGKTIITSIHQPSSQIFQSFDQLILLADGKTIFMVSVILILKKVDINIRINFAAKNKKSYFESSCHPSIYFSEYLLFLMHQSR